MNITPLGFAGLLISIKAHDANYEVRYGLVLRAVAEANYLGMKAGFRFDPAEPEWPVAFIELPTGQISWHIPQHDTPWDGHTTEEKYHRLDEYLEWIDSILLDASPIAGDIVERGGDVAVDGDGGELDEIAGSDVQQVA